MDNNKLLEKVKLSLRIRNSTKFDQDILDNIEGAKLDLLLAGIVNQKENDPLIIQAIKYYCRANVALDNKNSEKFKDSYESLKEKLSLIGEYTNV